MKKTMISLVCAICFIFCTFSNANAQEAGYDLGGTFQGHHIVSTEFFTPEYGGVAMVVNMGAFSIDNYDTDVSFGLDAKLYTHKIPVSHNVCARISVPVGIMTSMDYSNVGFDYGIWMKTGIGYKIYFYGMDWFSDYIAIEPGMNIYIGTSDIIPALSNIPTNGLIVYQFTISFGV